MDDAQANIVELKHQIDADSLWQETAKPSLLAIKDGTITIDLANSIIKYITAITNASLNTGTYENITNSGKLNLIRDYDLRNQIVEYHSVISGVEFIDDYFYRYFSDFVMPFVFENYNVLKDEFEKPKIIRNIEFSNVVAGYYSMVQQREKAY